MGLHLPDPCIEEAARHTDPAPITPDPQHSTWARVSLHQGEGENGGRSPTAGPDVADPQMIPDGDPSPLCHGGLWPLAVTTGWIPPRRQKSAGERLGKFRQKYGFCYFGTVQEALCSGAGAPARQPVSGFPSRTCTADTRCRTAIARSRRPPDWHRPRPPFLPGDRRWHRSRHRRPDGRRRHRWPRPTLPRGRTQWWYISINLPPFRSLPNE